MGQLWVLGEQIPADGSEIHASSPERNGLWVDRRFGCQVKKLEAKIEASGPSPHGFPLSCSRTPHRSKCTR